MFVLRYKKSTCKNLFVLRTQVEPLCSVLNLLTPPSSQMSFYAIFKNNFIILLLLFFGGFFAIKSVSHRSWTLLPLIFLKLNHFPRRKKNGEREGRLNPNPYKCAQKKKINGIRYANPFFSRCHLSLSTQYWCWKNVELH